MAPRPITWPISATRGWGFGVGVTVRVTVGVALGEALAVAVPVAVGVQVAVKVGVLDDTQGVEDFLFAGGGNSHCGGAQIRVF